jgi:hypothetical protein
MSSPAWIASAVSSSCATGHPNQAATPSPAYTPMLPPSPVIVSVARRWKSNMSSPNSSASMRCESGVESTTSQNSTASWRRSPRAAGR